MDGAQIRIKVSSFPAMLVAFHVGFDISFPESDRSSDAVILQFSPLHHSVYGAYRYPEVSGELLRRVEFLLYIRHDHKIPRFDLLSME